MSELKNLLIKEGRIIDPGQGIDETASLLITGGKISWLGTGDPPQAGCDVINGLGLVDHRQWQSRRC